MKKKKKSAQLKTKYIFAIAIIVTILLTLMASMLWVFNFYLRSSEKERVIGDVKSIGTYRAGIVTDFWQGNVEYLQTISSIMEQFCPDGLFTDENMEISVDGEIKTVNNIVPHDSITDLMRQLSGERDMDIVGIANPDGYLYSINKNDTQFRISEVFDREYFLISMSGQPALSEALESKVRKMLINVISVPVFINNDIAAVIMIAFYSETILKLWAYDSPNIHTSSFIINQEYSAVTPFENNETQQIIIDHVKWVDINYGNIPSPTVSRAVAAAEFTDGYISMKIEGKKYYACVNSLADEHLLYNRHWRLITVIPQDDLSVYAVNYSKSASILAIGLSLAVFVCFLLIVTIIHTAKKNQEGEIFKYRSALTLINKCTFEYNPDNRTIYFSESALNVLQMERGEYTLKELLMEEYFVFNDYQKFLQLAVNPEKENVKFTVYCQKLNTYFEIVLYPISMKSKVNLFVGVFDDVTDTVAKQNALQLKAQTDSLTHLYNRETLEQLINNYLKQTKSVRCAMLLIDIDEFKNINDTYGHFVGDELLIKIATVLRTIYDNDDLAILGRLGGDEFGLFVKNLPNSHDAEVIAKNLCDKISSIPISGNENSYVACSIGVALYPRHGTNFGSLYQCADNALYVAKEEYGSYYSVYDNLNGSGLRSYHQSETDGGLHPEDNLSLLLTSDDGKGTETLLQIMTDAIENEEFVLYKQPKVSTTGSETQAEALVRWDSPKYGLLMPNKFIPLFEKMRIMERFDFYILEKGIAACSGENAYLKLSINQSLQTITTPYYLQKVKQLLNQYDYKQGYLTIEITERGLFTGMRTLLKMINKLHELGFCISIDDFGSGFTTLNILKDLEIDEIKIDRAFIDNNNNYREKARIITHSICSMAKMLGIKTVAEGVETKEQAEYLAHYGCDYLQGFYFGKAVPDDVFEVNENNGEYRYPKTDS